MSSFWVGCKEAAKAGEGGRAGRFYLLATYSEKGPLPQAENGTYRLWGRRDLQPNALIGREYCATQPVAQQGKPQGGVEPCQGLADLAHPRIHLNTGGGGRRKGGTDKQRMAANAGRRGA